MRKIKCQKIKIKKLKNGSQNGGQDGAQNFI